MSTDLVRSKMTIQVMIVGFISALLAFITLMGTQDYGIGVLKAIYTSLLHNLMPFIILLFVVIVLFAIFGTPGWIKRLFKFGSG